MKTRKIGLVNYLAYGSGDFLGAGTTALTAAWLLYFYTTFCGLSPIEATLIFATARVLDAVISPLMGFLTDNFGSDVTIVRYGNADEAYLDLKAGRVLALLADASAIDQGLLSKAGGDKFEYVGPALTDRQWFGDGMGIAVRKGDQDLKAKLDEAIKTLRANGKYQEINQKYFKYDIYGG